MVQFLGDDIGGPSNTAMCSQGEKGRDVTVFLQELPRRPALMAVLPWVPGEPEIWPTQQRGRVWGSHHLCMDRWPHQGMKPPGAGPP